MFPVRVPAAESGPANDSVLVVVKETAMTPIEAETHDYLEWMEVHNYARTTIENRGRYLGYFVAFAEDLGVEQANEVTLELLLSYQHALFAHRKRNGQPLSFGTQAQRLVPVTQFFSWLRREHRIDTNPAADLLMPRPDRRLPEATLSAAEMAALSERPRCRRRHLACEIARCWRSSTPAGFVEASSSRCGPVTSTSSVAPCSSATAKGAKDRYVPIGERALFWVRLYVEIVRPGFVTSRFPDHLFLSSSGTPLCPDWLCRKVRDYLRAAGIEKRGSCHLLRHSVATLMLEGGADIRYVAEMLGHARLETTQRYTRVSIDRLRAIHATCHPAAGMNVAAASELCAALPQARSAIAGSKTPRSHPRTA